MPIAAGIPILQTQILSALSLGNAAQQSVIAAQIAAAVASVAPMGLFPAGPAMIPLIPAGVAATQAQILSALSMGNAAQQSVVAAQMAAGISLCAPMAPPAGLSFLQMQIQNALSLGQAAQQSVISTIIATAISTYYMMGGVL